VKLWHGGAPGLRAGDILLPRAETNIFRHYRIMEDLHSAGLGGWLAYAGRPYPGHSGNVYLTGDRQVARDFAAGYSAWLEAIGAPGMGCLYRVKPDGPAVVDPTAGDAWACQRAVVKAVDEESVPRRADATGDIAVKMMRDAYQLWKDRFNGGLDRWPGPPAPATRSPQRA
jgi:hypothetical protein